MRRMISAVVVLLACNQSLFAQPHAVPGDPNVQRYDGYQVVRVSVATPRELLAVSSLMDSLFSESMGMGTFDVLLAPAKTDALRELGIRFEVLNPDVQRSIDAESARIRAAEARARGGADGGGGGGGGGRRGRAWFDDYKDLNAIYAYLDTLVASKPGLSTVQTIGSSLEGRPMKAIRITGPGGPGNRPAVIYHGGQHAREWISPMTVMYFADQLIAGYGSDARITNLLNNSEVIIVPVMNPDGYSYTWTNQRMWRKNRRNNGDGTFGVDLNRNWGYQWGGEGASNQTNNETYRGPSAFSEPETQVMRDFITANPRLKAHIDFHSYSQLILSPWAYTDDLPPDAALFDVLNARMEAAIEAVHGTQYVSGPTYVTIYPASGGANDWTYGARGLLGWGWELRDTGENGFTLPADQIIPTGEETIQSILTLGEYIAFPFTFGFPQSLPETIAADTPVDINIDVVVQSGGGMQAGTGMVYARTGSTGPFTASALVSLGGNSYRATLPATECGDVVQYYFEGLGANGMTMRSPADAPNGVHQALAYSTIAGYSDACESASGWTVGAAGDNATTGIWGVMDPQATDAQPGDDHSPVGTQCWITDGRAGSSVGTYDVDSGTTTLTSPMFSAVENVYEFVGFDAVLSYARWYSNNQGSAANSDSMPVLISNNNGATWTALETVSENAGTWVVKTFRIADFVTPTSQMKLRFQARDLGDGSIVEAGVDDIAITIYGCPRRPADFNGDGFVDLEDYSAFVLAFEAGDQSADFDESGFVDTDDFDAFVRAFEAG
ncbi:MAG: hypothetical protein IT435_18640 [Phycisphaerales bacterium]|nr:hypothetical protein [Phycisphaerales bacterium]